MPKQPQASGAKSSRADVRKSSPIAVLANLEDIVGNWDDPAFHTEKQIHDLVQAKFAQLKQGAKAATISPLENTRYTDFIHPDSDIYVNYLLKPFHLDDTGVYELLLELIIQVRMMPSWQQKPMFEIVEYALNYTIARYFGNHYHTSQIQQAHDDFYMQRLSSEESYLGLSSLRRSHRATALEKAALAHNLFLFIGYKSTLIISPTCELIPQRFDLHAYNLVALPDGGQQLFDAAFPVLVFHNSGDIFSVLPAAYPISTEQYDSLLAGGSVEIRHRDYDTEFQVADLSKRHYAGPAAQAIKTKSPRKTGKKAPGESRV